ncbi:unnamed protein product [Penicillium salamii]|uniref:CFEM domain-containing protein n=1 Tax=Penicillium salamii TaxID=1612424 RepID=A0A9W4NDB7_9EURO|nr:unnamed protein product [Penicillium salamii]CAG8342117.1 unnamed protein product [Penicillium salamii]CAG8421695.1 unnamed protein product [Penicillium salamii]
MKFNVLLTLSALLATACAQGLGDLPDCSKTCATGAIPKSCGIDIQCICEAKSFLSDVSCCVADKCSKADQDTTLKVARSLCARGGVTDLPTSVTCSTDAGSSSTSSGSSSTETGTKSESETSAATQTGSTTTGSTSVTDSASTSASASSSAAASTGTNAAVITHQDSSLIAAAGAAAALAMLI